jgi:ABC-type branched-subunit amino acid transport system ATPase component
MTDTITVIFNIASFTSVMVLIVFGLGVIAAPIVVGLLGLAMERLIIRRKAAAATGVSTFISPKLAQRPNQAVATLSRDGRKMLAIGRALRGNPKLLMLDESTEGVWAGVIEEIAA